jgi:DnaJ-class molecular chaperone
MNKLDHYTTLGIPRTASPDDIRLAFRKLAAEHHPDRGGDVEKFKEIQVAYSVLGDPERRSAYDTPQPGAGWWDNRGGPTGRGMHDDIFGHFFNSPGMNPFDLFGQRPVQKNRTINITTSITLLEAMQGKDLIADLQMPSGRVQTINVKIPAGIQDGNVLRLQELGDNEIPHLPRGDIHLTVTIQAQRDWTRQGDDLITPIYISCVDAMLGCKLNFTTLDGKTLEINVNTGIQHGQVLSAPGYGMPNVNDPKLRGRLLLQVNIEMPESLSPGQRELLSKFHQV